MLLQSRTNSKRWMLYTHIQPSTEDLYNHYSQGRQLRFSVKCNNSLPSGSSFLALCDGQKSVFRTLWHCHWSWPSTFWIENVMFFFFLTFAWNFVIISVWIVELRHALWGRSDGEFDLWPPESYLVIFFSKFEETPSRCSWDSVLTDNTKTYCLRPQLSEA